MSWSIRAHSKSCPGKSSLPYACNRGFTLLEVLISLVLLTVVTGAVYSSFLSVQKALNRFDNVAMKYHDVRTVLDIMRRELEGAVIRNAGTGQDNRPHASFIMKDRDIFGKKTSSVQFVSVSAKKSLLNTISYYASKDADTLHLLRSEAPVTGKAPGYSFSVIDNIEGFTVETKFNGKWVGTWNTDNTGKLPEVLRITLTFDDRGRKVQLREYAKPRIGFRL